MNRLVSRIASELGGVMVARLANDRSYRQLVEVVPQVLSKAEDLIKSESVRTLDAIHIASAIIIQDSFPHTFAVYQRGRKTTRSGAELQAECDRDPLRASIGLWINATQEPSK